MRLLRAELRKLRRPLVAWTCLAVVVLIGIVDWQQIRSVSDQSRFATQTVGGPIPTSCDQFGLPPGPTCDSQLAQEKAAFCQGNGVPTGPQCDQLLAEQAAQERQAEADYRRQLAAQVRIAKAYAGPIGSGAMAGGLLASLFGAVAILLLAAGHVGNEWSGRTIKQVFTQEGRRWRVLAAKIVSLWLMAVGLLMVAWIGLALVGQLALSSSNLMGAGPTASAALRMTGPVVGRALLVFLVFTVLGVVSAAITRNTLGSFFLGFAVVIGSLILTASKATARYNLGYWVAGWMGFHNDGLLTNNLWTTNFYPLRFPKHSVGLAGLLIFSAACVAIALVRVTRSDVKV
jgi:ABC-type transport system involved in multi-copper enzyme maturation permease subunit